MANRLVLMPVAPRVTVSEAVNLVARGCAARVDSRVFELSQAAPATVAERMRNSRRRIRPPTLRGYTNSSGRCSNLFSLSMDGVLKEWSPHHPKAGRATANQNL